MEKVVGKEAGEVNSDPTEGSLINMVKTLDFALRAQERLKNFNQGSNMII